MQTPFTHSNIDFINLDMHLFQSIFVSPTVSMLFTETIITKHSSNLKENKI